MTIQKPNPKLSPTGITTRGVAVTVNPILGAGGKVDAAATAIKLMHTKPPKSSFDFKR